MLRERTPGLIELAKRLGWRLPLRPAQLAIAQRMLDDILHDRAPDWRKRCDTGEELG